jgi:hypothetical protein
LEGNEMKKTVHIVIKGGCVIDAYADTDVEVVVYDLDTQDPEMLGEVEKSVAQLPDFAHEVEIL